MSSLYIAALLAAICVSAVVYILANKINERNKHTSVKEKLRDAHTVNEQELANVRKSANLSEIDFVKNMLRHQSFTDKLIVLIKTSRLQMSVSIFILISICMGIFSFFFLRVWLSPTPSFTVCTFITLLPFWVLVGIRRRYVRKFSEKLPDALSIISSAIKSGHSLSTAIDIVATHAPYPVCAEFDIVRSEIKLGQPLDNAMKTMYERIQIKDLRILLTGITVNQQLGGSLSEILNTLEKTIRDRFGIIREINTLSAQGRFSTWILFSIPVILVFMYMKNNSEMFTQFLHSDYSGVLWIVFWADVLGLFWMRKIVKLTD